MGGSGNISANEPINEEMSNFQKIQIPKIEDDVDPEPILANFEKLCTNNKIHQDFWVVELFQFLGPRANKAIAPIPLEQFQDYAVVKKAIITEFNITPNEKKRRFRGLTMKSNEDFTQFAQRLTDSFETWIDASGVDEDFNKLSDLMLREQFEKLLDEDLQIRFMDHEPESLANMGELADKYTEARKSGVRCKIIDDSKQYKGEEIAVKSIADDEILVPTAKMDVEISKVEVAVHEDIPQDVLLDDMDGCKMVPIKNLTPQQTEEEEEQSVDLASQKQREGKDAPLSSMRFVDLIGSQQDAVIEIFENEGKGPLKPIGGREKFWKAQENLRRWSDRSARKRKFEESPDMLLLKPIEGSSSDDVWERPYKINRKWSDWNYEIELEPGVFKIHHVNIIGPWRERKPLVAFIDAETECREILGRTL